MSYPLIHNDFLTGFSSLVLARGGNPDTLCTEAGLKAECLSDREVLIPINKYARLLNLATQELKYPEFCMELARRQSIAIHGPLTAMLLACDSISSAINVLSRHIGMRVQGLKLQPVIENNLLHLTLTSQYEVLATSHCLQEHLLASLYNLLEVLCDRQIEPQSIHFLHRAPLDAETYRHYFQCPVMLTHSKLQISVDASILDMPIAESAKQFAPKQQLIFDCTNDDSLAVQIKHLIGQLLIGEQFNADRVCHSIGFGIRTLQRRLREENTSFQTLVDEVRYEQATKYLENSHYRLTDIAVLLGYSGLSAFTRSFKRGFGVCPKEWRQRHLEALKASQMLEPKQSNLAQKNSETYNTANSYNSFITNSHL